MSGWLEARFVSLHVCFSRGRLKNRLGILLRNKDRVDLVISLKTAVSLQCRHFSLDRIKRQGPAVGSWQDDLNAWIVSVSQGGPKGGCDSDRITCYSIQSEGQSVGWRRDWIEKRAEREKNISKTPTPSLKRLHWHHFWKLNSAGGYLRDRHLSLQHTDKLNTGHPDSFFGGKCLICCSLSLPTPHSHHGPSGWVFTTLKQK